MTTYRKKRKTEMRLTNAAAERAAKALAETCNGGSWLTHYTEAQRQLWIERVRHAVDGD